MLALTLPLVTLLVRWALGFTMSDAPMLVMFVFPIMLSAYVGGLGPGLAATAVAVLLANYELLPPYHSFTIASRTEVVQSVSLFAAGTLVSGLVEALHRARRRATVEGLREALTLVRSADLGQLQAVARRAATQDVYPLFKQLVAGLSQVSVTDAAEHQLLEAWVAEREAVERALRRSEAQYRALVEQLPAIIYTANIDAHSTTTYVSPQVETILGFTPAEWLADPELWLKQVHPDDRAGVLSDVGLAHADSAMHAAEYRALTRDGQVVWLRDSAMVVRDDAGQPLFLQGLTLDITRTKRNEEAVRAGEERFRRYFELGLIGMAITSPTKGVLEVNDQMCAILGYARSELMKLNWAELTYPDDLAADLGQFQRVLAGEIDGYTIDKRWVRQDRQVIDSTMAVRCVRAADGTVDYLVAHVQDITARKRAEAALLEERALLARRVEERTADLSLANAELARAARLKDEFLAAMSHELRTPLNAILGRSQALEDEVYGPLQPRQANAVHAIEESGRHLLSLINDILDLSKIEAGRLDVERAPLDVAQLCAASVRLVAPSAAAKGITVRTRLDGQVVSLWGDERRLKQLLVNLLGNAVKFTPAGGAVDLDVRGDSAQGQATFTVVDTGIGIAADDLAKLFQPFVQIDSRLTRQYEGTGLGLALVRRLAEAHAGSVAVTSTPGVGSCFSVTLPWRAADQPSNVWAASTDVPATERPARAAHAGAHSGAGARAVAQPLVLLADDNAAGSEMLRDVLTANGYAVTLARTGREVLLLARGDRPDAILLDIQMPELDGLEVMRQIRADAQLGDVPIIALTALAMPGDRERCLQAGADDYLAKPVNLRTLLAALDAQRQRRAGLSAAT